MASPDAPLSEPAGALSFGASDEGPPVASRLQALSAQLDEANQRLRILLSTANDAVVTIDDASRIIDWNAAAERIFGWSRDEALGQVLTDLIVPHEHRAAHHAGLSRFLQGGPAPLFERRVETTGLRRSGETLDIELSVWPVPMAGRYTFSSFIRDVSRRKAAEKALEASEAKYRQVVENVNEGILVTAGGRILYANPRGLALTGVDEATALARPFIEFIHPEDRERVLANHMRRLRGEAVENHYQFRVNHPDDRVLWLEISAVVFEWQGQPATLNFLIDVTERRRIEDDLRAALARERELSELKSRFIAVVSHEFRTPLAAILSSVELLEDHGAVLPEADRREVFGLVKSSVTRMNKLIEQVLLSSRLESGRFLCNPRPLVLGDFGAELAGELEQAVGHAERVQLDCSGCAETRLIDPVFLRHIMLNLIGNALKYSPPGTPVRCAASTEGEWLRISVRDEGIGIPEEDLPHLFDSFHRGSNVGNIQGTGIGLHVVKQCAELHGGGIEVQSRIGQGSCFVVTLRAPVA